MDLLNRSEKIFKVCAYLLVIAFAAVTLYPIVYAFSVFRYVAALRAARKLRLDGVAVQHHDNLVDQARRLKRLQCPPDRTARFLVCFPPGTRLFRKGAGSAEHVARPDLTASLGPV
jgi:ABC-type maltose transport system permease subunit